MSMAEYNEKRRLAGEERLKNEISTITGYKLKSHYIRSNDKVIIECDKGHEFSIVPDNFYAGGRCVVCYKENKKYGILQNNYTKRAKEKFYHKIKETGFKIIAGEYINHDSIITVECPSGHISDTRPTRFLSGNRCRDCQYEKLKSQSKKDFYEKVNEFNITSKTEYVSGCTIHDFVCEYGHKFSKSASSFRLDNICPVCKSEQHHKNNEIEFSKLVCSEGYSIVSEFTKLNEPIILSCPNPNHSEYTTYPVSFRKGLRCRQCFNAEKKLKSVNDFDAILFADGYKRLGDYVNTGTPIDIMCDKGHIYKVSRDNYKSGCRCPTCNNGGGYDINKPGTFYVIKWNVADTEFIKFGITNKTSQDRIRSQNSRSNANEYEVLYEKYFFNGQIPIALEKNIKDNLITGVVSKDLFPDGFTETVDYSKHNIDYIENLVYNTKNTLM